MTRRNSPWLVWLSLLVFSVASPLFAQFGQEKPPAEQADYNWEADAKKSKLADDAIATLKKQGFVVTADNYRQIFEPYLSGTQVFITSDTIINAYSVLLEDSIQRLERMNARHLTAFLDGTWKQLDDFEAQIPAGNAELRGAVERDRLIIGVALELSAGEKVKGDPKLADQIDGEAQRVIAATGQSKPAWLGPPDSGFLAIDYTRFKPRGFYAGEADLERYFRAVSWLQAIPFRYDSDGEFRAFMVLYEIVKNRAASDFGATVEAMRAVRMSLDSLLGEPDNADLFDGSSAGFAAKPWEAGYMKEVRKSLIIDEPKDGAQINDQIALPSKDGKPERSFRLLAAHRVPDAVLFAHTDGVRQANFPSGLEVAAALGSPSARNIYEGKRPALLAKIDAEKKLFAPESSLYASYLDAVSALFQPVDAAAPDLFRGPAWQTKSLETFLGGWAQARHAWTLQTKQNVEYLGAIDKTPSGFVEPVPDFYSRMGRLTEQTHDLFAEFGAFEKNDNAEAAGQVRALAGALRRYADALQKKTQPSGDDMQILASSENWLHVVAGLPHNLTPEEIPGLATKLDDLAGKIATGNTGSDPEVQNLLAQSDANTELKWEQLAVLCAKLEALSQKQLRGVPFNKDDDEFLSDYGEKLAAVLFYDQDSYEVPVDDAPRVTTIYTDPNSGQMLQVGMGRPQQIYVLYPYGGKQFLMHGAVFPYYEFPNDERLTDKEWADRLASPSAPDRPDWLGALGAAPAKSKPNDQGP